MGLRILVIDDDTDFVPALTAFLEECGHQVRLLSNWYEAFLVLKQFDPQVALVDLSMPGIRGEDVAASLKRWSRVHVLLHSARSPDELVKALAQSKADGIVRKGRPRELVERLAVIQGELVRQALPSDAGARERSTADASTTSVTK